MDSKETFKQLRKDHGLNQGQFAKVLGVSQSDISQVETGKIKLSIDTLQKYLKVFGKKLKITL